MTVTLDLLVMIIGVLMYALCINPKLAEIGRLMFACGLLALLFGADRVVTLLHGMVR